MDCREEGNFKKSLAIWNESCWQRNFHIQNKQGRGTYLGCYLAGCLMGWECKGESYLRFMFACEVFRNVSSSSTSVSHSVVSNSATPRTVARQAPLSMGFSRQEYWSGLPVPSPEDLPNPGIKPGSPALQADSLPSELQGRSSGTSVFPNNDSAVS